jgi:hypothetical protein
VEVVVLMDLKYPRGHYQPPDVLATFGQACAPDHLKSKVRSSGVDAGDQVASNSGISSHRVPAVT